MKKTEIHDVVIAGGGPAAISAAILLGRCLRKVLLCDASHSELQELEDPARAKGRDCCCPSEFLRTSRSQLHRLESVTRVREAVSEIRRVETGFRVTTEDGRSYLTKSLLLASDFSARLPLIIGARQFFGYSLHLCPFCDGWEHRRREIGAVGSDDAAISLALKLLIWAPRVKLYTHGGKLPKSAMMRLGSKPVDVVTGSIRALEGHGRQMETVRMENGSSQPCQALFFSPVVKSYQTLTARVGCDPLSYGRRNDGLPDAGTGIQGLFVTGEVEGALEMAVSSAAEGVKAAEAVNQWLIDADHSYLAIPSSQLQFM